MDFSLNKHTRKLILATVFWQLNSAGGVKLHRSRRDHAAPEPRPRRARAAPVTRLDAFLFPK